MSRLFVATPSYAPVESVANATSAADALGRLGADRSTDAPLTEARASRRAAHRASDDHDAGVEPFELPDSRPHSTAEHPGDPVPLLQTARQRRLDLSGLGPLERFAQPDGVTDLFVNGEAGLWIDTGAGLTRSDDWHMDEYSVRQLAVRLIALGGRHIDEASPCVDVRLSDGIRVHAVLPPVSTTGTLLSVRLPRAEGFTLAALYAAGLCGSGTNASELLDRLRDAVRTRENLLITGAAGSGKTTLLAALLGEAPPGERIVAIEDVAELRVAHPHVVALESRQANLEGAGKVGMDALVREALRMRPDRLVLGECRGAEIRDLLAALNTGHDGGAGTLHANSLGDVPARLEALGALAGMSAEAVGRQTASAIDLVVHLERRDGVRVIAEMGRFALDGRDRLVMETE